jgi:hypothetical protein
MSLETLLRASVFRLGDMNMRDPTCCRMCVFGTPRVEVAAMGQYSRSAHAPKDIILFELLYETAWVVFCFDLLLVDRPNRAFQPPEAIKMAHCPYCQRGVLWLDESEGRRCPLRRRKEH